MAGFSRQFAKGHNLAVEIGFLYGLPDVSAHSHRKLDFCSDVRRHVDVVWNCKNKRISQHLFLGFIFVTFVIGDSDRQFPSVDKPGLGLFIHNKLNSF